MNTIYDPIKIQIAAETVSTITLKRTALKNKKKAPKRGDQDQGATNSRAFCTMLQFLAKRINLYDLHVQVRCAVCFDSVTKLSNRSKILHLEKDK